MPVPDLDATVRGLYRAATGQASWDETLAGLRDALGAADLRVLRTAASCRPDSPAAEPRWSFHPLPASGCRDAALRLGTHLGTDLSVQIAWSARQSPDATTHAWLNRLAPHLQGALRAGERLRQWPARSQLGELLLDTLVQPAWLLHADARIAWANAAARRTATAERWLLAAGPALSLRDPADQQALETACGQMLAAPQARPVLVPALGAADLDTPSAAARPAPAQARWLLRRLDAPGADPLLLAILFDPQADEAGPAPLSAPLLAGAFGFTPAESRVAVCLAQGCTVREIAGQLDVAPSTVRSHLDAVMAKLGVARKLDAVRLLVQGGWMWRAWPGEGMQDA